MSPRSDSGRSAGVARAAACAPWVRTRLRTAPAAACALGLLVLVTAFLAAAFPRAVDAYESKGLRHDLVVEDPRRSVLELTAPPPALGVEAERAVAVRKAALGAVHRKVLAGLPEPVRADAFQSSYGIRTTEPIAAGEKWLPRPSGLDPKLTYATPSALPPTPGCATAPGPPSTARSPLRPRRSRPRSPKRPRRPSSSRWARRSRYRPGATSH